MGGVLSSVAEIKAFLNSHDANKIHTSQNGLKLSYSQYGTNRNNIIFMFPGISGNRLMIHGLTSHLDKSTVMLIFIDYSGYGESTLVKNRSLSQFCDQFYDFINVILHHTDKFNLIGNSAGCVHISALILDKRFSKRIKRVALLVPWCSLKTEGVKFINSSLTNFNVHLIKIIALFIFYFQRLAFKLCSFKFLMSKVMSKTEYESLQNSWNVNEEAWKIFVKHNFKATKLKGFQETFALCCEAKHDFNFNFNDVHSDVKILVMYGDKDDMVPPVVVENFYKKQLRTDVLKKNFEFRLIKDGTHDSVPLLHINEALDFLMEKNEDLLKEVDMVVLN